MGVWGQVVPEDDCCLVTHEARVLSFVLLKESFRKIRPRTDAYVCTSRTSVMSNEVKYLFNPPGELNVLIQMRNFKILKGRKV